METWIIISKLMVLSFCALKYAGDVRGNTTAFVLFILLYISVNMGFHIFKNPVAKQGFLALSIMGLIGCFLYVHPLFIMLLPMNLCEGALIFTESLVLPTVLTAFPLVLLGSELQAEYLVVGGLSFTVFEFAMKMQRRLQNLTAEGDRLREKVAGLTNRLHTDMELQHQMEYSAQLEVRNKVAQEIHDQIGHTLAGSLIQLEAAKLLMETDSSKSKEIIGKVINILREGMENFRATLRNIKPAAEQLGINRLKLTLEEFAANNCLRVPLVCKGNLGVITPVQWKIICDNISEALTNSLKYSGATTISVNLEVLNKFVKAEVRDNGVGAYEVKKGLGITGMEERSSGVGGQVIVDGTKGFSVITLLPLEVKSHD